MRCGTVRGVIILALSLLCAPRTVAAQQPGHVARVGILVAAQRGTGLRGLEQRLRELGYVEGQNLRLEFRTAEGHLERFPALVADLVRLPVDVLVAFGPEATLRAVKDATSTLPIVMIAVDYDPMALGYIVGLPRPGGNITGVFFQQLELTSKRLELLKEALPQLRRVAVLWDGPSADQWRAAAIAARELGVQVQSLEMHQPSDPDFTGAVRAAVQERAEALLVLMSPIFYGQRDRIAAVAAQYRLPTMFGVREFVEAGGLMAYGANLFDMGRRAADYVDKILKGAKPADLPVEQPTKFELTLNLKTAQTLGITLPPTLLLLADEVIR
jgi:putative tryptophan/tyrosine transport system substrate-binding protein